MSTYSCARDVQQQSQRFAAFISNIDLLLLVLRRLISRDAISLALASKAVADTLSTQLQQQTATRFSVLRNICCPRVIIVASGSKKLLEVCLRHDGSLYNSNTPISRVTGRSAAKARHSNKRSRPGYAGWLTGIAVNPADGQLYVCDYGAKGVIRYLPNNLSRQQKFASGAALSCPEGITFAAGTCYVTCIANNSIVALNNKGKIKQVSPLIEGLVPWGMTVWEPERFVCARKPAAAAAASKGSSNSSSRSSQSRNATSGASGSCSDTAVPEAATRAGSSSSSSSSCGDSRPALFVAVDVEYQSDNYTVPPETATGGVLCVKLSGAGDLQEPAFIYSKVTMKRPSGLTFDHEGHLWVTSAQQQLLRLAGPMHNTPGVVLQTINLPDLLPDPARSLYPFDVQAVLKAASPGLAASATGQQCESGMKNAVGHGLTHLVVTLHRGSHQAGAVAVLEVQSADAGEGDCRPCGCKQHASIPQTPAASQSMAVARVASATPMAGGEISAQVYVHLKELVGDHPLLKEPNMLAVVH